MVDDELDVYTLLGLEESTRPNTAEEDFYERITSGSSSRMDNMLYFLKHEIEHFHFLHESGVTVAKRVADRAVSDGRGGYKAEGVYTPLTNEDYIKLMIRYYLQMMHLTRFIYKLQDDEDGSELPKLDLDKAVALFMQHAGVKKIIATTWD